MVSGPSWVHQLKPKKQRVLLNYAGGLLSVLKGKAMGDRRDATDQKGCWGSHFRNFHMLVTLRVSIYGMHLHEGASVSLRPPKAAWPNKMIAGAAIPWSSLVKINKD